MVSQFSDGRGELACCEGKNILSCQQVALDTSVLGQTDMHIAPLDSTLAFQGTVADNLNAYHYTNKDIDLILTHNPNKDSVHGHAILADGRSFVIEYCGDNLHALIELDVDNLGEDIGLEEETTTDMDWSVKEATDDDTIVTYSVKVYYTADFASTTADVQGYLDQVIAETNQGYINSNVPLRIEVLCTEQATINDIADPAEMLEAFQLMKGSYEELRDTADVAVLLVNEFNPCGYGRVNSVTNGHNISVSKKSCALGYFSFGHEIGHNFGLQHNPEEAHNSYYPDGHGHLIAKGSASTGYRTILAYQATGHRRAFFFISLKQQRPLSII